jgi:NADPH:quinone reductase-like Zn-dependent oxidoreductase
VRALELTGFEGPSSLRLVERPEPASPGPGEALVRFRAMALNRLDVFVSRGLPKRHLPAVLGADGAAIVEAVGSDVDPAWVGREVVLYPAVSCGACDACRAGQDVHCPSFGIRGEHTDGTFREAALVRAADLYSRPAHLSWEESAALPLTWMTAWRLLFTRGRLQAGTTLVVVGAGGGVATAAILLAKAHGMRVIATSRSEEKRAQAQALGADVVLPTEGFGKAVQQATDGRGAEAVVDTVGPATLDESFRALAREGQVLTVGATSGPKAEILLPRLWFRHLSLVTSTMGNRSEFQDMLVDVGKRGLRPPVDRVFPLADAQAAFAHLEASEQFGKVVLVP